MNRFTLDIKGLVSCWQLGNISHSKQLIKKVSPSQFSCPNKPKKWFGNLTKPGQTDPADNPALSAVCCRLTNIKKNISKQSAALGNFNTIWTEQDISYGPSDTFSNYLWCLDMFVRFIFWWQNSISFIWISYVKRWYPMDMFARFIFKVAKYISGDIFKVIYFRWQNTPKRRLWSLRLWGRQQRGLEKY